MMRTLGTLLTGMGLLGSLAGALADPGHQHAPATKGALSCPVMKSPIKDKAKAPHLMVNNVPVYLCCADCDKMLRKDPAKYVTASVKDPVTGKPFKVTTKTPKFEHGGALFLFSSAQTKATFLKHPGQYAKPHHGHHS